MDEKTVCYRIYQMNDEPENLKFRSYEEFEKAGYVKPPAEDYRLVYEGVMPTDPPVLRMLEKLYVLFNQNHPHDFKGHSMSISDVIEISGRYYFCDRVGFREVSFDIKMASVFYEKE